MKELRRNFQRKMKNFLTRSTKSDKIVLGLRKEIRRGRRGDSIALNVKVHNRIDKRRRSVN